MKRQIVTFWRIIVAGIKNLTRNAWLSIAAIAVMVVAIIIIGGAVVVNVAARNIISEVSKSYKISIYLKEGASETRREQLTADIKSDPAVFAVTYISREEATQRLTTQFGENQDQGLLQGLALAGSDTLPTSLEVSVSDLDRITAVADKAKTDQYASIVDDITIGKTDARKTIDRAASVQKFIVRASIASAVVFAAVSVLIIFNTIRIAIFTRSEEIRTMKLIGATPNFIRGPYLVESAMYGVIAGAISSSVLYSGIVSLGGKFAGKAEFAETYDFFTQPKTIILMCGGAVLMGVLVGVFSSMLAMEKYLKLKRW